MKCRYCKVALAPLRTLTDGEFCCDEHRQAYAEHGPLQGDSCTLAEAGLVDLDCPLTQEPQHVRAAPASETVEPVQFQAKSIEAPAFEARPEPVAAKLMQLSERLLG